jgi:membrane dipeptidase
MPASGIKLAREIDRVPSSVVALDAQQERRFQRLIEQIVMVDVHEHPMVLPEDMEQLPDYLRTNDYRWGYQAVKQGGWTAVATANFFRGLANTPDLSMVEFEDVLQEVGLMLSDLSKQIDVLKVGNADDMKPSSSEALSDSCPPWSIWP